jgi:serine/threonine protein kinase
VDDPLLDTVVAGKYRVLRKIGEGGMAFIYEVQHVKLLRSFALKGQLPEWAHNPEAAQRFEREAELLGSLRHPNVIDIADWVYLNDGTPCMVLEFLHGATLQTRLQRGPLPFEAIARLGEHTCSALALAHRNGITHRDVKPENFFISIDDSGDDRVKLLDFGVSKLRGVGRLSGVYRMLGTPSYMSPEQASGNNDAVGPSSDCWAMGAILYEMATRQVAFKGIDIQQTLMLILEGRPPPMATVRPDTPPEFIDLVDRCLSHDPERRIQTIEDLRFRLRNALPPPGRTPLLQPKRMTPAVGLPVTPHSSGGGSSLGPKSPSSIGAPSAAMVAPPVNTRRWVIVVIAIVFATLGNLAIALAT